jgi:hypothetical protein
LRQYLRTTGIHQILSAWMVIALVWLVSLGARSQAFHHWICGESVQSVYQHVITACAEEENGHISNDQTPKAPDPLQPFCQSGVDLKIEPVKVCSESFHFTELTSLTVNLIETKRFRTSTPSRAPPVLV